MARNDPPLRDIAGKYRPTSVLGEGGMGTVWRAHQLDEQGHPLREVAVKTIRQDTPAGDIDVMVRRFQREVRAAMRLKSPHTVTVHDFGQEPDGQFYLVMELVDGPTLKQAAPYGLATGQAVLIAAQICEALVEAHGLPEPIVHRDLKPANLFLQDWPRTTWVKVGDFGIAKLVGDDSSGITDTGSSIGTPLYMSPEQWRGDPIDGRADLYALGVMLYQMLAGRTPFIGDPRSLMYQHLNDQPPALPASVPMSLRQLVEALLSKSPGSRPRDAAEVRASLLAMSPITNVASSDSIHASSLDTLRPLLPGSPIRSERPRRLYPTVAAGIGLVLCSYYAWRSIDQNDPPVAGIAMETGSSTTDHSEGRTNVTSRAPATKAENDSPTPNPERAGLTTTEASKDPSVLLDQGISPGAPPAERISKAIAAIEAKEHSSMGSVYIQDTNSKRIFGELKRSNLTEADAIPALLPFLKDKDPLVRWKAMRLLVHYKYADAVQIRHFWMMEPRWTHREVVLEASENLADGARIELLRQVATNDDSARLRSKALERLSLSANPADREIMATVLSAVDDEDSGVKLTAIKTLRAWKSVEALGKAKELLAERSSGDTSATFLHVESADLVSELGELSTLPDLASAFANGVINDYVFKRCATAYVSRFGSEAVTASATRVASADAKKLILEIAGKAEW